MLPAWNARASYSPDAMELNDLYRDVILDHNRKPRNFGGLEPADASVEGFNPLCGDRLTVRLQMKDDKISDIRFEGQGCAISTASASLMTEAVKGKTRSEALHLFDRVHQLLTDDAAASTLARVGFDATFLDRDARALSGGEAQRVCLARTLVTAPEVVLMDEVTSSVDPAARGGLEELARELAATGVRIAWVTHNLDQMHRLADHVLIVIAGRIVHAGAADALGADAPIEAQRFLQGEAA